MGLVTITNRADLDKAYGNGNKKLVVLEFMVPWSELCKFMDPAVEEMVKKYKDYADFCKLDVDKFKEYAREKGVEVLPTFLLLKDGKECKRIVGINKEELEKSIEEHKGAPVMPSPKIRTASLEDERDFTEQECLDFFRRRRQVGMYKVDRDAYYEFITSTGYYLSYEDFQRLGRKKCIIL